MVKSVKSHHEEEDGDGEFASKVACSQKVKLDETSSDQKAFALRSKHSETEQRRRSKINERFQILRDLIPQSDQKRDKASFLLEVIQYIQFLQEKMQLYEGTYRGWNPEPSKLMPWRNNCGAVESFLDQTHSQLVRNGSEVDTGATLLDEGQNPVECNLSSDAAYKTSDCVPMEIAQPVSPNIPLQPNLFGGLTTRPSQGSFSSSEQFALVSQSQIWQGKSCTTEHSIPGYNADEQEELKIDGGQSSISYAYSQGLLNILTHALQSSGVDLSQANISVQLDVGRQANCESTETMFNSEGHEIHSSRNQVTSHPSFGSKVEESNQAFKRLRTEKS